MVPGVTKSRVSATSQQSDTFLLPTSFITSLARESLRAVSSSFRHGSCCFIIHISNTSTKNRIFSLCGQSTLCILLTVLAINFHQGRDFSHTPGWQGSLSSQDPLFSQPASLPGTSCVLGLRHATILDSAIFYLLLFL